MIERALTLMILSTAIRANASCVMDPPELGDIGPGSAPARGLQLYRESRAGSALHFSLSPWERAG
jgi:hypothetical protein